MVTALWILFGAVSWVGASLVAALGAGEAIRLRDERG